MNSGDRAKRVEDVLDGWQRLECARQRARLVQLAQQKRYALVFIPLGVGASADGLGDGVQRLRMA